MYYFAFFFLINECILLHFNATGAASEYLFQLSLRNMSGIPQSSSFRIDGC